jgi:hypothetical protein
MGGPLRDLEPFLIALFFAIRGLPLETCRGLFSLWLSLGIFWICAGFWMQYFRMDHLLFGLAPFLDLGFFHDIFLRGFSGFVGFSGYRYMRGMTG